MKPADDTFSFTAEPAAPCAGSCPLARIPEPVWKYWLHLPFRKRHPWLYRLGILLLVMLLLLAVAVLAALLPFKTTHRLPMWLDRRLPRPVRWRIRSTAIPPRLPRCATRTGVTIA